MSDTTDRSYQTLSAEWQQHRRGLSGPRKTFLVVLAGNTNGAHWELVQRLKRGSHREVTSAEGCDYVLLFCPVASRVGTDVGIALSKAPGGKAVVLVVMHHTYNTDYVIADSRRLVVDNPNVLLTVDCLFHENSFLQCQRNEDAWRQIDDLVRPAQGHESRLPDRRSLPDCSPQRLGVAGVLLVVLIVVMLILVILFSSGSI